MNPGAPRGGWWNRVAKIQQRERMLLNLDTENLLPSDPLMEPLLEAEDDVHDEQSRGEDPAGQLESLNSLERNPSLPWDLDQW